MKEKKILNERDQMKRWIAISEQQQLEESFLGLFKAMGPVMLAVGNAFYQLMRFIIPVAVASGKNLGQIIDDVTQFIFEYYAKEKEPGKVDGMSATPPEQESGLTRKAPIGPRLMAYLKQRGIDFDEDMEAAADNMDKVFNSSILRDKGKQMLFKNFVTQTLPEMKDKIVRFLKAMAGPKVGLKDGPTGTDKMMAPGGSTQAPAPAPEKVG